MSRRDISFYIVDIFIAIDKIDRYTSKFTTAQTLLYDELSWDATIRELEIIGEATKYLLAVDLISQYNRRIVDFRNQLSHGYFGIDENIVWDIVTKKLDSYKKEIATLVKTDQINLQEAIKQMRLESHVNDYMIEVLDKLERL